MGSLPVCFSAAAILRCESFTSLQSQLLIIPTGLELIFSTALIFTNWGTGWRHLLLTAEGWSYFALVLLELLSHTIPAVRDSVTVFSIVDIVLGATSFLPIFFYTLFVYLFSRGELIDTLPKRFQRIANVLLLFFIPAVVALNELSSFIGIHRRTLSSNGQSIVAIGFNTFADQQLWTFLTSLTLALLTAFEAINFCFAFYRLIRAFVDQRRIETTSSDAAHLIRGIGWITAGFKLGAIETVVGFVENGGFGAVLVRRIVRFLSRAFLIVGIIKGLDRVDDFAEAVKELREAKQTSNQPGAFRRSRLGLMISNPRFSTFRQLSPMAREFASPSEGDETQGTTVDPRMTEFAQLRRAVTQTRPASPLYTLAGPTMQQRGPSPFPVKPTGALQRTLTSQTAASAYTTYSVGGTASKGQRVTVHLDGGSGAPTLQMRFSNLEIPSPALIAESVKARPVSREWVDIARSSRYAPSIAPSFAFDPVPLTAAVPPVPGLPATPNPNPAYPEFIYERNAAPESTIGDAASAYSYSYPSKYGAQEKGKGRAAPAPAQPPAPAFAQAHTRGASEFSSLNAVRELAAQFPVPGIAPTQRPSPIPESPYRQQQNDRRSWDAERGYGASASRYDAYGQPQRSDDPPPMRYAYGGMEYPATPEEEVAPEELEEPTYRYAYDGPVSSPERIPHPYADAAAYGTGAVAYSPPRVNDAYSPPSNLYSPPNEQQLAMKGRHTRGMRSDTTLGTTPRTYASSRLEDAESRGTTPNSESVSGSGSDPFQFDDVKRAPSRVQQEYQARYEQQQQQFDDAEYDGGADEDEDYYPREGQGVPEEVYMDDGPHSYRRQHAHNASVATRTSAALLQMTQRDNTPDWAPAGVEFTPSVFSASTPSSARNTLKKKRPSMKSERSDLPASADTLASSWLHGPSDMLHDDVSDGDVPGMPIGAKADAGFARVKSVGRVRAPKKATPAPVSTKHVGRGSVYIQPITVPPVAFSAEVQIVQGGSSADSYNSEFSVGDRM
ncbi:hypothetical protein K438DRAFT_1836386 [Mycena galopus ATCC 62051]|nr:hypothetical protein K438DRAFT_1836386 [Mycena galopus ATCC 62051]